MGQEKGQRTEGKQPHFTQTPPLLFWAPLLHSTLLASPPAPPSSQQEAVDVGVFSWPPLTLSVGVGRCRISQLAQARLNEITTPSTSAGRAATALLSSGFRVWIGFDGALSPSFFCASQPRLPASRLLLLLAPSSFRLGAIVTSQRRQRRDEARRVVAVAETRTWKVLDNRHGMFTADTAQPATREVPLKREGDTSSGTFVLIGLQPLQHPKIQPGVGWVPYC